MSWLDGLLLMDGRSSFAPMLRRKNARIALLCVATLLLPERKILRAELSLPETFGAIYRVIWSQSTPVPKSRRRGRDKPLPHAKL